MNRWDGLAIVGDLLLCAGVWMVYPPAALILAGAFVVYMAVRLEKRSG